MRLKARLKRLEAEVRWLQLEGRLRSVELRLKILDRECQLAKHKAARQAKAARPSERPQLSPPPPPPPIVRRTAAEMPAPPRASPREESFVQPFDYDPPEHMQIRPVRWRIRGPDDHYWEDDNDHGPQDEDYDIFAEV
jgi:hypothetical protein